MNEVVLKLLIPTDFRGTSVVTVKQSDSENRIELSTPEHLSSGPAPWLHIPIYWEKADERTNDE